MYVVHTGVVHIAGVVRCTGRGGVSVHAPKRGGGGLPFRGQRTQGEQDQEQDLTSMGKALTRNVFAVRILHCRRKGHVP